MTLPTYLPKNESKVLRIRVERLLKGDFNPSYLSELFLALRDYSGGRQTIMEIGNFVAHCGERNIGITTEEARGFFAVIRFFYQRSPGPNPLDIFDLPKNFSDLLGFAFRRTENSRIKTELRLKRSEAERRLNDLRKRIQKDAAQKVSLARPTNEDLALIKCFLGQIVVRPAFDDEKLIEEFTTALHANGLLYKNEFKAFLELKTFVGLFAVSKMHQCIIDLGDGTHAQLSAGATLSQRNIEVSAASELFGVDPTGRVFIAATFFRTGADVMENTEPELHPTSDQDAEWKFPIEFSPTGKLKKLV